MVNSKIRIYADGADLEGMREIGPQVDGFTTNPSLARKAGVTDYRTFGKRAVIAAESKPVSIEVLADEGEQIIAQALEIATWGRNVFVKVPVVDSRGGSNAYAIANLANQGIALNVTAVMTLKQVLDLQPLLAGRRSIVSIFAGRIADTGRDPAGTMRAAAQALRETPEIQLLWASPREVFNVVQAERCGCHIITLPRDLIAKMAIFGKDLNEYSRETSAQFHEDARGMTL